MRSLRAYANLELFFGWRSASRPFVLTTQMDETIQEQFLAMVDWLVEMRLHQ